MKKLLLSMVCALFVLLANTAPFKFLPYTLKQPDGSIIECFVSGDEYFNWTHDAEGYSIIKGSDGYYYYAQKSNEKIKASSFRVNDVNPNEVHLEKWVKISKDQYLKKRKAYEVPANKRKAVKAPHTGTINNIVIYIRFAGESEIETTREVYDNKMNADDGESLKDYFYEVSYNQLTINSTHYPSNNNPSTSNSSYQDSHERSYFQPYDANNNPDGYKDYDERREREHQLLVDAVNWVNTNDPVPSDLDIDADNDGYVDNICFMINDDSGEWADLLWAHRWVLWTYSVSINGKQVYDYTFQPENQVSVRTLCHEMYHTLGAPDLYHYYEGTELDPVGRWDLMQHGSGHMGAYMKWKYANAKWVTEIPEINAEGTYSLNPLSSSTKNCYKILSPNSATEYFVVEYRDNSTGFEKNIPGTGLLVYRINPNFDGNAQYDGISIFDEVYLYRPGGSVSVNGDLNSAYFSNFVGRTEINDETDPNCFLYDGSLGGLSLSNINIKDSKLYFDLEFGYVANPVGINFEPIDETKLEITWELNGANNDVLLAWSEDGNFGEPVDETIYNVDDAIEGGGTILVTGSETTFEHSNLEQGKMYFYKIWSLNENNEYSSGKELIGHTTCNIAELPLKEEFSINYLPLCWGNIDNQTDGLVWLFNNPAGRLFNSTTSDNGFAILDSEYYGSSNSQNTDLVTSALDFSNINKVKLSFEHYFRASTGNFIKLLYSTDDGENWSTLKQWVSDVGSDTIPEKYEIMLTDLAGEENVKFAWRYIGSYGYYWMIDDVEILTDTIKPSVTFSSDYEDVIRDNPFEIKLSFNEEITEFEIDDLEIENAVVESMETEDNIEYTLELTAITPGEVTIVLPEASVSDDFENTNDREEYIVEYGWPISVETNQNNQMKIFPNPSNGKFNIKGLNAAYATSVYVFDVTGKEILHISGKSESINFDLTNNDSGIYFIKIINNRQISNSHLIVK